MKVHLLKLIEKFNRLDSDKDRFRFILEHKGVFKLNLDNDDTFTTVSDDTLLSIGTDKWSADADDWNDKITNDFYSYLGWSDGVVALLEVVGIEAEPV